MQWEECEEEEIRFAINALFKVSHNVMLNASFLLHNAGVNKSRANHTYKYILFVIKLQHISDVYLLKLI